MAGRSILIVDDDQAFVEAVAIFLEDYGYRVRKAHTARQGIVDAIRCPVDLALIDVHLPDLDGTDVAAALRRWKPFAPVIFLSSDDAPETQRRCAVALPSLFLPKPLVPETLLETILDTLGTNTAPPAPARQAVTLVR